jgi:hypothetical protein
MTTDVTKYSMPILSVALVIIFSLTLQAATPAGWSIAGKDPEAYEAGTDARALYHGTPSIYLKGKEPMPKVAGLLQQLPLAQYAGKRVRFSAATKSEGVEGGAQLLVHLNRDNGRLTESVAGPIRGNSDWQKYEVVVDVLPDATGINIGVSLAGQGTVWLNDIQVEVVGPDVPTTTPSEST